MIRLLIKIRNGITLRNTYKIFAFVFLVSLCWASIYQDYLHSLNDQQVISQNKINVPDVDKYITAKDSATLERKASVKNNTKTILLWSTYFGKMKTWKKVFTRLLNQKCAFNDCKLVTSKKKYARSADAIVFNANDLTPTLSNFFSLPARYPNKKHRRSDQYYVFMSFEAPTKLVNINFGKFRNYFNWTMTFRTDSDIFVPYGKFHKIKTKETDNISTIEEQLKKKKMAFWMASNCLTDSNRESLVFELQKLISIDIVGKCGSLTCGDRTLIPNLMETLGDSDPCDHMISEYIFYLSFENSLCTDYVTEKFYRAVKHGAIPVVFGGANYSNFAPEHSFIDVRSFKTTEDIANYLKQVATNVTLFDKYHEWRKYYEVELGSPYAPFICDLCEKLHKAPLNPKPHYYNDLKKWYVADNKCYTLKL